MPNASSPRRRCAARASSRPISASTPPSAISTPPNQIKVTNGFHHRRSCQRPCSSLLADHGVELAVPAVSIAASLVVVGGVGRSSAPAAAATSRPIRRDAREARPRARSSWARRPASTPTKLDQPRARPRSVSPGRAAASFSLREGAVRRHAEQRDRDAEMGERPCPRRRAACGAASGRHSGSEAGRQQRRRRAPGRAAAAGRCPARRMKLATSTAIADQQRRRPAAAAPARLSRRQRSSGPTSISAASSSASGAGDGVEIGRPDRQLLARQRLGDQRIERADEDDAEDRPTAADC